jgi:hypothetical protein
MVKFKSSIAVSPQSMLLLVFLYYGFSIYVDANLYNVTEIPIFLLKKADYFPSIVYLYSWLVPTLWAIMFLIFFRGTKETKMYSGQRPAFRVLVLGYLVFLFIALVIMPSALNRADAFLEINQNYPIVSLLLPIIVWFSCFVILDAKSPKIFWSAVALILIISVTLVDRSYLMMGVIAGLIRAGPINLIKLGVATLILFLMFTFWKIVLFWLVFDVDFASSLENLQFGVARFEAITSQSIFINCIEFARCTPIDFGDFIRSTIDRIMPSFIYDAGYPSSQEVYIDRFFPEIADRGGGLGFSLPAEFGLVFGVVLGPWMLSAYVACMLLTLRLSNSVFAKFIFTVYFLRFLRVDLGTGIKGIFVFGLVSLCLYLLITSKLYYRNKSVWLKFNPT